MDIRGNIRRISIFELFTSAAITLPASWVFTDLLLLRMKFNLALFGFIKSCMFLMPALVYWALTGVIRRSGKDEWFCRWGYFVRITLPLLLPLTALVSANTAIRMWMCVFVFSLGYSAAMIANNTVLALSRRAVGRNDFNRWSLLFVVMLALPAAVISLPSAYFLGKTSLSDAQFFLWFFILEAATGILYIPAFCAMRNLDLEPEPNPGKTSVREQLAPFLDRTLRPLLVLTFLQSLWLGLVSTYWVVYLLKVWRWNSGWVALTEAVLCFSCLFGSTFFGRLADRHGYRACFLLLIILMAACSAVSFCWWGTIPALILSIALIYNANNGILSSAMRSLTQSAAVGLAPAGKSEKYIAVQILVQSTATFLGCCLAGYLFGLLAGGKSGEPDQALFRTYFLLVNLLLIPQFLAARGFRHAEKAPSGGRR